MFLLFCLYFIGLIIIYGLVSFVLSLPKHNINKRIVNGETIVRGEWPFLVSLHYNQPFPFTENSGMKHICGGVLIHRRWVLTAASCIGHPDFPDLSIPENWDVVVSEYNQYLVDDGEQIIKPEAFFIHPGYQPSMEGGGLFQRDIGLIKLSHDVTFGPYAGTIVLDNRVDIAENAECQIGGWGQVSLEPYGWGMHIPLRTTVYSFNHTQCLHIYSGKIMNTVNTDESGICAGIPQEKQSELQKLHGGVSDACQGDFGGPLICRAKGGEFVLTGIISSGYGCGSSMYPRVCSKVSYYRGWILATILSNYN